MQLFEGLKMTKKRQAIQEAVDTIAVAMDIHNNQLKALMDSDKITAGSYYYLLNPHRNFYVAKFYGHDWADKKQSALLLKKSATISEYKEVTREVKKFIKELELVVQMQEHDLEACRALTKGY